MGKALVVKNVNFNTNKLTTVNFQDIIECTDIELSSSTASMTAINTTYTLTATLTPSNTTQTVTWSSSNTAVATVSDGVVTQTGIGTAVITATCGEHSDTCTVTAVNTLSFVYELGRRNYEYSGRDYIINETGSEAYAALESSTATAKEIFFYQGTGNRYPILLGNGASQVSVTVDSNVRVTLWFIDSTTACTYSVDHSSYNYLAKVISGDASAYDKNVPVGPRTVSVPSGADSIVFSLQYPSGTVTDAIVQAVTIVVS